MKFKTLQRTISTLDILMIVCAVIAFMTRFNLLWVLAGIMCVVRIYLYLKPFPCPHCGETVRPDRSTVRCPHCNSRMDE